MLNTNELEAWKCFKLICLKFLGLRKTENFEDVVANVQGVSKNLTLFDM